MEIMLSSLDRIFGLWKQKYKMWGMIYWWSMKDTRHLNSHNFYIKILNLKFRFWNKKTCYKIPNCCSKLWAWKEKKKQKYKSYQKKKIKTKWNRRKGMKSCLFIFLKGKRPSNIVYFENVVLDSWASTCLFIFL